MQKQNSFVRQLPKNGFTLLEILVALAIFAISAAAMITQVNHMTRQAAALEERNLALSVAENQLNEQLASGYWPKAGETRTTVTLAQRDWLVTKIVDDTNNPALRRIDIAVSLTGQKPVLASLRGYQGKNDSY